MKSRDYFVDSRTQRRTVLCIGRLHRISKTYSNAQSQQFQTDAIDSETTEQTVLDHRSFYCNAPGEYSFWVDPSDIEGTVPAGLNGTLFRNGPGIHQNGGQNIHPFDGDGMVARFCFRGGAVHFANTFVKTEGYLADKAAGKPMFRSTFKADNPRKQLFSFDLTAKNVANTGVIAWAGKLFALWEAGPPHELDPFTLETKRLSLMNGVLKPGDQFSAHYKIVEENGRRLLVNFGVVIQEGKFKFWELDDTGAVVRSSTITIPGAAWSFYHDFLVTEDYYVLFQSPMSVKPLRVLEYLFFRSSAAQLMTFDPAKATVVHAIPRRGDAAAGRREFAITPPHFCFHHINAYQTDDGRIVADSVAWPFFDFDLDNYEHTAEMYAGDVDRPQMLRSDFQRYELNMMTGSWRRTQLYGRHVELPSCNPDVWGKPYSVLYATGASMDHPTRGGPGQTIVKLKAPLGKAANSDVWFAGSRRFVGEAVFVPREGAVDEDDGWLFSLVNDAEKGRTSLAILDALRVSDGPVAMIHLKFRIPNGFHGSWARTFYGPKE